MAAFLVRSNLSNGDLKLYLSNDNGYSQDAFSVRWTVFDSSGLRVSGDSLPAIRKSVGEYYAPWFSDVKNGNYVLRWELRENPSSLPRFIDDKFFVVDPSSYQPPGLVQPDGFPLPGGLAYLSGTNLGPGDLPLYLLNDDGVLSSALAVFWTVCDVAGNPVSSRSAASQSSVGTYYASWFVNVPSGDYFILWEYQRDIDSPLQSVRLPFCVINASAPYVNQLVDISCQRADSVCSGYYPAISNSNGVIIPSTLVNCSAPTSVCCSPITFSAPCTPFIVNSNVVSSSFGSCSSFEIPRTIHLVSGVLPASGDFTQQAPYFIPNGVRHITFYIGYTRGAPGGFSAFKLLWGNGIEETQETVIDSNIPGPQSMFLQELTSPVPSDDTTINFVLYISVPGGSKTVRLLASENGVPGNPGTLAITLTASSN